MNDTGGATIWTCPKFGREFKNQNQDHYCGEAPKTIDEYFEIVDWLDKHRDTLDKDFGYSK